jgi:hypothetical protein
MKTKEPLQFDGPYQLWITQKGPTLNIIII